MRAGVIRRGKVSTAIVCVCLLVACTSRGPASGGDRRVPVDVATVLGGDAAGFAIADTPRAFEFPADHGPHPDFRNEWWYVTGNVTVSGGRAFGYQITFFRTALFPERTPRDSAWAARDAYMAHLAVGDLDGGRFLAFERFSRGAMGLAGARSRPLRVWLEDWSIEATAADADDPARLGELRVLARQGAVALDLRLQATRAPLANGELGLSRKGAAASSASHYYSLTRLATRGTIAIGDDEFAVQGTSWMDREWSTSALEAGQVGWDWFALNLSDGADLMLYVLRRDDGSVDAASSGTLRRPDGSVRHLPRGSFRIQSTGAWPSDTGVTYPAGWRIDIPDESTSLEVEPRLADQEIRLTFRYWEGAVSASGTRGGTPVVGTGFAELTGYGPASVRR